MVFFRPFARGKINHHHRLEDVMKSAIEAFFWNINWKVVETRLK